MPSIMPMSAVLSGLRGAGRQHLTASTVAARQAITGSHVLRLHDYTQVIRKKLPTGKSLESPTFGVAGHDWRIICYPNGTGGEYDGCTSLFLKSISPSGLDAPTARLQASVLDRDGTPSRAKTTEPYTFSGYDAWGWKDFLKKDAMDENHLVDDCLTVLCDVTVDDLPVRAEDITAAPPEPTAAAPPFMRGLLAEAIWSKQPPDVTAHAGGETFPAHRWILEARSPVLKADLEKATSSGNLHIDGMDAEVFKALLQFMYTDVLPSGWDQQKEEVERLLVAADRYGLEKVKLKCEEALCARVDMGSVAAMLALAERHGCVVLNEACMNFLSCDGNMRSFMATDGFEWLKKDCPSAALDMVVKQLPSLDGRKQNQ